MKHSTPQLFWNKGCNNIECTKPSNLHNVMSKNSQRKKN